MTLFTSGALRTVGTNTAAEARDIHKTYRGEGADVEAVCGVSLAVSRGEFVSLTGPSGCGKSTLLNILACADRPSSGVILINGIDVTGMDDNALTLVRRDSIGYVFQFFNLMPTLTVAENVALPLVLAGVGRRDTNARVGRALEGVGIAELARRTPATLSGGQQQRAAIARAIVRGPALLLADEPTGNLDSGTGRDILMLLRSIASSGSAAVLMATHGVEAASVVDRVLHMRDGMLQS